MNENNKYICKYCNKDFKRRCDLVKHLNKYHDDKKIEGKKKCKNPNCKNELIFYYWEGMEDIIVYANRNEEYCSRDCSLEYNPRTKYKQDCKCPNCGKKCANEKLLKRHLNRCKKRICEKCGKEFFTAAEYNEHIKRCPLNGDFKCTFCGYTFDTENKLKDHLFHKHQDKTIIMTHKCQNPDCNNQIGYRTIDGYICEKSLRKTCSDECLKKVAAILTSNRFPEKLFKCPACKYTFSTQEQLDRHFKIRHLNPNYKYKCVSCGATFADKTQLHQHYNNFHKDEITIDYNKCKNPACTNMLPQVIIKGYVIKQKLFCNRSCASIYNGLKFSKWKDTPKNAERRYKLTLRSNGKCKWYNYIDRNGIKHRVQGKYELAFAKKLDELNIEFITHPKGIRYIKDNKSTYYFPDFYIPSKNLYVDPKSMYYLKLSGDKFKIFRDQHPDINLLILTEPYLKSFGIKNINKYVEDLL